MKCVNNYNAAQLKRMSNTGQNNQANLKYTNITILLNTYCSHFFLWFGTLSEQSPVQKT
uniref:Uncharacterized protein n=1 Tax=Anguilla anguilla TaxID=7936 RepID=A0A0E9SB79_ANGAN